MRQRRITATSNPERGAVAVTVAVLLVVLVGFAALAVDVGYLMATRNELQNVADAAALAAARQMGNNYQHMSYEEQLAYDCSSNGTYPCSQVVGVAQQVGLDNQAARAHITIAPEEIEIGKWDAGATPRFSASTIHPNAVRVTTRRDENLNSPITTLLAGLVGVDDLGVVARATAALTGESTTEEGELELPVGISDAWFNEGYCGQPIRFSPTNSPESCAGWSTWEYNSNDAMVRRILDLNNPLLNPPMNGGDSVNFIGGDLSTNTFEALETLFQHRGHEVDLNGEPILTDPNDEPVAGPLDPALYPVVKLCEAVGSETPGQYPCDETHTVPLTYPDGTQRNLHYWRTKVLVYDRDDCSNPNQSIPLLGFAEVLVTEVLGPPDKSIIARVECEKNDQGVSRGGGGNYGTFGSVPGLVE